MQVWYEPSSWSSRPEVCGGGRLRVFLKSVKSYGKVSARGVRRGVDAGINYI